jgi:hypothetical protein
MAPTVMVLTMTAPTILAPTILAPTILALAAYGSPAAARTLEVGPGLAFAAPSQAASVAADGDVVRIAPGTYFDCAIWHASHLTIAASGPDVLITDRPCAGKAAFVIEGDGVVISGLSFQRIRAPDGNGAGIRAAGRDLTIRDSRFINNQVGILAGGSGGNLLITGTTFSANKGGTPEQPLPAVLAGPLDLLRIEHSVFEQARGGQHIRSSALRTDLVDNHLSDEGGGMSGPLVSINGGIVTLTGNIITLAPGTLAPGTLAPGTLAPGAAKRPGAVLVHGQADAIAVRGNTLVEPEGDVPLLRNWTGADATESGNIVPTNAVAVSDNGATYHRLRNQAASLRAAARDAVRVTRHQVANLARALKLLP